MAGSKARRSTDLLLAVKGVEQSSADLLGRNRQIIQPIAALTRQRRRRYIQVSGKIERHCPVEEAANGFNSVGRLAANPLEHLVYGVRIGEHVVGGLPIGVLVGGAKARDSECRRISKCSTEVGGRGPVPRRG